MNFLNSIALWGGLAAAGVAVPIMIHLLHQKYRRRTDWAAMELLRRALIVRCSSSSGLSSASTQRTRSVKPTEEAGVFFLSQSPVSPACRCRPAVGTSSQQLTPSTASANIKP